MAGARTPRRTRPGLGTGPTGSRFDHLFNLTVESFVRTRAQLGYFNLFKTFKDFLLRLAIKQPVCDGEKDVIFFLNMLAQQSGIGAGRFDKGSLGRRVAAFERRQAGAVAGNQFTAFLVFGQHDANWTTPRRDTRPSH